MTTAGDDGPYAVWRSPHYRLYAAGWFLLTFGKNIETVAALVYVHTLTRSPLALGYVALVQALPVMVLAIPAGHLADRFDRRRVLLCSISLGAAVALVIMFAVQWHLSLGWIYLLLCLGAVGASLGGPSRSALLPQIVAPRIFSDAVTWNSTVFQIASVTGPAAGGLIVDHWPGTGPAFAAVVICRLLALLAIALLQCEPVARAVDSISLESLVAGVRFVWRSKLILAPITLDLFAVLFGGVTYLLPVFTEDILHVGASKMGYLRSAEAIGAVFTAMLIAHLPPMRHAGRTMLWAVAGFGAVTVVFGLSRWFWLSMLMMFLLGALDNISVVVRHTLVQMLTPDEMRGRVSAVNNVFIVASNELGGMESGLTAWLFGPIISVVGGGIATILVVLGAVRRWPEILSIGSLKNIRPAEAEAEAHSP